jgi:hypothetical protein
MNGAKSIPESPAMGITAPEKRVILSMGGKGRVGKTCVMTGPAEWVPGERHSSQALGPGHGEQVAGIADALLRWSGA